MLSCGSVPPPRWCSPTCTTSTSRPREGKGTTFASLQAGGGCVLPIWGWRELMCGDIGMYRQLGKEGIEVCAGMGS